MKDWIGALAAAALILVPAPMASAQPAPAPQTATVPPEVIGRAGDVLALLRGETQPEAIFAPAFLAQVPAAQVRALTAQLTAAHGAAQRIELLTPGAGRSATLAIAMERALVRMTMHLGPDAPHLIIGLVITDVEPRGANNPAALLEEFRSLPGQASVAIARLGGRRPELLHGHDPERPLAIGSAFKLVILAELSRQVQARQRRWTDVAPVDRHSLPSGILQDWPLGSPATLHTLATLMISRSDNTATDVLLRLAGRENVERMMARMGMASAARNRPFLTTMEAFQLKADTAETLATWQAGDEATRRRLLRERADAAVDLSQLSGQPRAIDTVEWFASAADMVRVMDWLRTNGDATAHAILAVNPGLGRSTAGQFAYLGFKGGSEPGVINLTFLVRNNGGTWHAVTGSWNNVAAPVDEARFVGLMSRALQLVR